MHLKWDYNFAGYPSTFFDGGQDVVVGGYPDLPVYTSRILQSASRVVTPLDMRIKAEWLGNNQIEVTVRIGNNISTNSIPAIPAIPSGSLTVKPGETASFSTSTTDPDNDELLYQFDWGDGRRSDWLGPYLSGANCTGEVVYPNAGPYPVKVRSKDCWGDITDWTTYVVVNVSCCSGDRGNVNDSEDGLLDISDLLYFVDYMFGDPAGPGPACNLEGDVNNSGTLDISDLLYLVDFFFAEPAGPAPAACQ